MMGNQKSTTKNRHLLFDAKQSRETLKAIRYGMELHIASVWNDEETDRVRARLTGLKKHYLARRMLIDERKSAFGNVIFYQLVKEKYAGFHYRLDERGILISNLYDFKIDGKVPSLLTMLINDEVRQLFEPEKRYHLHEYYRPFLSGIEQFFRDAMLIYPDTSSFKRFLDTILHAKRLGETLHIVAAICPDYSYIHHGNNVRYTFESIGVEPGLAGTKLLAIVPTLLRFLNALELRYTINLYGGDFESLAYEDDNSRLGVTRVEFVERVHQQIARIVSILDVSASSSFFFDELGDEQAWKALHERTYLDLASGNLGSTGLEESSLDEIFATRLPLYREWFKGSDECTLRKLFLKQAADYALMGEIYAQRFEHFVVLGVDHHRMAPFYSFAQPVAVIYRQTDYIVEPCTNKDLGVRTLNRRSIGNALIEEHI
jgi:hypothetical protein